MYIQIDGPDATGKSTLIRNIIKNWDGDIDHYFDPGISHHAVFKKWQMIRDFVKNQDMEDETETLLFFALRQELMAQVEHSIFHKRDVIQDRGPVSTYIYQGKLKGQEQYINKLEAVVNFRRPDITFLLMAPFEVLTERLEKRASNIDKFKSNAEFREKVWKEYMRYAQNHPYVTVIDASGTEEDTYLCCKGVIDQWKLNSNMS
jgi:dTMP kinase